MTYIVVDVETDGPIPGDYSMLSLGAVIVTEDKKLGDKFYDELKPISKKSEKERIKFLGLTKEKIAQMKNPEIVIKKFVDWVKKNSVGKPVFVSDNNGFDWMFVCWYLWHFAGENPFGYSSKGLSSIYRGIVKDMNKDFNKLRNRKLSHNALDDAKNNAELLIKLSKEYGLKL